ncbi:MAG TPA: TonB-dependent receptor [Chitinophagaceae bacterium]|nr:TonB-dependent receptor [Chitinophagaceae bacterium]
MRKIYLTGLAIAASVVAMAQTGTITGKVVTADGQPAAYVTITVKELQTATLTDDEGIFRIAHLKPGSYTIAASHIGLATREYSVNVSANANASVGIELTETSGQLEQVIVNGRRGLNARPAAVSKIAIDPMDLPQSISVVNAPLIRHQQSQRLSDVIKNVNGVYLAGARASTQETFYARGYNMGSGNLFKNGTRINTGAMPEVSSLEKVEVLKGSAAILYGNVAPGGIINLVTKQPKFNWGGEISMRAGSYGLYKPAIDVYGPITGNIAFRINGTYESAESFRDVVSSERFYINPSLLFKIGRKTDLLVQGDHLRHQFTPDFGIGSLNNTIITPVSRNTFFGAPWQYAKTNQSTAGFALRHELNTDWNIQLTGSYQNYQRDYFSTERIQAAANGDWTRPLGRTNTGENYYIAQADLNGKFNTGKMAHTLLAGMDAERYLTTAYAYSFPATYDIINLLDPKKYTPRTDMPASTALRYTQTPVVRIGAYVQDLVSISEKIKLLAGVRWSLQESRPIDTVFLASGNKNTGGGIKTNKAFTPRIGIVYRPVTSTSLFASYANSFSINNGTDVFGKALPPSMIDQYEIGVKNDFFKGDLSVNLTAYRIINNNLAQTAQFAADGVTPNNNTALKELTGETTSDGIELDIAGRPAKGLDVRAGYSYNYMRYTKTPDAKGNFVEGERLVNSPAHTANATVFYTIKAFRFGATYSYVGDRVGGWNNTIGQAQQYDRRIPVDEFSTIDVTAGYTFRKLSLLVKLSNLTNTYSYYVHENYSVNPIPPRQVIASLAYKF